MKNLLNLILILGLAFILTGCPPKETTPPETDGSSMTLDDLDDEEELTDEQMAEDENAKESVEQRKKLIKELAVKDLAEKKELLVKREKVEEANGKIVFEWPRKNALWSQPQVQHMHQRDSFLPSLQSFCCLRNSKLSITSMAYHYCQGLMYSSWRLLESLQVCSPDF